jgi:hypothetical protein
MEIQVVFNHNKVVVKFKRDVFLQKLEGYYQGDVGLLTEAFNKMEADLKKEILKL